MSWFRPSRERRGPDPRLAWKIGLFIAGAAFGTVGMYRNDTLLVGLGILALAIGVLLRFLPPRG